MNIKTRSVLSLLGVMLVVSQVNAVPLVNETFSYADGNLVGNGAWAAHSGAGATPVQVSSGSIVLNQGGGSREDVNINTGHTLVSGETFYASFDVTVTGGATDVYFASFLQGASNFGSRVWVTSFGGADFTIGLGNAGSITSTWATGLTFGETYTIVVSYDLDALSSTLWINPVDASSTSITAGSGFNNAFTSFAFRQAAGNSVQVIDNLKVGLSFADVAPVPEPASFAAIAGGLALAGVAAGRRRRGVAS